MKTSLNFRRSLAPLACATAVFMLGTSACTHRQTVSVKVDHDLPFDYMSGKYRQLFRTNPHLFHSHNDQELRQGETYYGTSMSK